MRRDDLAALRHRRRPLRKDVPGRVLKAREQCAPRELYLKTRRTRNCNIGDRLPIDFYCTGFNQAR